MSGAGVDGDDRDALAATALPIASASASGLAIETTRPPTLLRHRLVDQLGLLAGVAGALVATRTPRGPAPACSAPFFTTSQNASPADAVGDHGESLVRRRAAARVRLLAAVGVVVGTSGQHEHTRRGDDEKSPRYLHWFLLGTIRIYKYARWPRFPAW